MKVERLRFRPHKVYPKAALDKYAQYLPHAYRTELDKLKVPWDTTLIILEDEEDEH